jgi:hypothetical protein
MAKDKALPKITWAQFTALSESEREEFKAIATLLGLPIPEPPTERRERKHGFKFPPPKEYNLRILSRCILCQTQFSEDYFMRRAVKEGKTFLRAIPVLPELQEQFKPDKTATRCVQNCHGCLPFLLDKEKAHLAAMVVDLHWRIDISRQEKRRVEKEIIP